MAEEKDKKKAAAGKSGRAPKSLDLERLKNTSPTQAPRSTPVSASDSPGEGVIRTRVIRSDGPKLDLKFSVFSAVACMFVAMLSHIFSINGGIVLNDRYNLSYLMSKGLMEEISGKLMQDMLGLNPFSQPWLKASFIGDFSEYGLNFTWYHSVEVFWHVATVGLVFFYILTMARHLRHQNRLNLNPQHLALVSAALFASHPLTCQSVSYLSARSSLLGGMNYFLSLDIFLIAVLLKHPLARVLFSVMALYTGALCIWSNPECMTLPLLSLFSLLFLRRPVKQWQETVKEHPFFCGSLLALSIAIPCLLFAGIEFTRAIYLFLPALPPAVYLASQLKAFVFYYLRCALIPIGLSIDPPLAVAKNAGDPFAIAAAFLLAAIIFLLFRRLRQPVLGLAGFIVLMGFLPHAFLVQPDVVADWVAYIPLAGLCVFPAYAFAFFAGKNLRLTALAAGALILVFTGLSIYRDFQWASSLSLWESALRMRPKSALGNAMIAIEHLKRQEIQSAEKEAKLALAYAPEMAAARIAEARVLAAKGKYLEAEAFFTGALKLAEMQNLPAPVKIDCRLGRLECLLGMRKQEEASELLSKMLPEIGEDPRLLFIIGMRAFADKDYERAFQCLDRAVSTDSSLAESWRPLGLSALALNAYEPAYQAARKYMETIGGYDATLLFSRAAIMVKRESDAEQALKKMLGSSPADARALYLLSRLYKHTAKTDDWKKYRDEAIKADPEIAIKFVLPELDAAEASVSAEDAAEGKGSGTDKTGESKDAVDKREP